MKTYVGIAIHKSKALFKGYCRPSLNFNRLKGTLINYKRKSSVLAALQFRIVWTIDVRKEMDDEESQANWT